jgi:hypothetical protein
LWGTLNIGLARYWEFVKEYEFCRRQIISNPFGISFYFINCLHIWFGAEKLGLLQRKTAADMTYPFADLAQY